MLPPRSAVELAGAVLVPAAIKALCRPAGSAWRLTAWKPCWFLSASRVAMAGSRAALLLCSRWRHHSPCSQAYTHGYSAQQHYGAVAADRKRAVWFLSTACLITDCLRCSHWELSRPAPVPPLEQSQTFKSVKVMIQRSSTEVMRDTAAMRCPAIRHCTAMCWKQGLRASPCTLAHGAGTTACWSIAP